MPAAAAPPTAAAAAGFSDERRSSPRPAHAAPAPAPAPAPASRYVDERGRLVEAGVDASDRRLAILMHLSPLIALGTPVAFAIPLVIWLCFRDRSAFLDDHGRATLDALISYTLWFLLATVTVVGIVLVPVLIIVGLIAMIRAAVDAGANRFVRYPLALSILS